MSRTNMNRPLAATDLKHRSILWETIQGTPHHIIGNYIVNLRELRNQLDDNATSSADLGDFLNENFYIKDSNRNPGNLTVSELYNAGTDIEAVFDPLNISNITWDKVCGCAQRQYAQDDLMRLDQIETKLVLYADHEKQRQLAQKLQKQKEYYSHTWVHFHSRISSFWMHAFEVCLDSPQRSYKISEYLHDEFLDRMFFANAQNRWSYLLYIKNEFEDYRCLPERLKQIDLLLQSMEYALLTKNSRQIKTKYVQEAISQAIPLIVGIWDPILPEAAERDILNSPLTKSFYSKMVAFEKEHCLQADGASLFGYDIKAISKKDAIFFSTLRSSIADIMEEWNKLTLMRRSFNATPKAVEKLDNRKLPISDEDYEKIRYICETLGLPKTNEPLSQADEETSDSELEQSQEDASTEPAVEAPGTKVEESGLPE